MSDFIFILDYDPYIEYLELSDADVPRSQTHNLLLLWNISFICFEFELWQSGTTQANDLVTFIIVWDFFLVYDLKTYVFSIDIQKYESWSQESSGILNTDLHKGCSWYNCGKD